MRNTKCRKQATILAEFRSKFNGPLLAQTVQCLLQFSKHESKTIAGLALQCLFRILSELKEGRNAEDWRHYFPGIFSGLYLLCSTTGYKSGSNVLHLALLCILQVTALVANHSQPENVNLIQSLGLLSTASTSSDGKSTTDTAPVVTTNSLLSDLMSKINKSSGTNANISSTGTNTVDALSADKSKLPGQFKTMSEFQQWRVDILQRIEVHLPTVYRDVSKVLSPKQKIRVVQQLGQLIHHSSHFLGVRCTVEFVLCLLNTICDGANELRESTRVVWSALKTQLITQNSEFYLQLQSTLSHKFVKSLHNSVYFATTSLQSEKKLQYELHTLLGIGFTVHKNVNLLLYSHKDDDETDKNINTNNHHNNSSGDSSIDSGNIFEKMLQLTLPDLTAIKTIVLQNRRYTSSHFTDNNNSNSDSNSIKFIDGGYYRLLWKCTNDDAAKSLIRRLFVLLGRNGCLQDLIQLATSKVKAINHVHKTKPAASHESHGGSGGSGIVVPGAESPFFNPDSVTSDGKNRSRNHTVTLNHIRDTVAKAIASYKILNYALFGLLTLPSHTDSKSNSTSGAADATSVANSADTTKAAASTTATAAACTDLVVIHKCAVCQAPETKSRKLSRCSKCKAVHYCSREHQTRHWTTHKVTCGKEQEAVPEKDKPNTSSGDTTAIGSKPVTADSVTGIESGVEYSPDDIVDPDILLSSRQLVHYKSNSGSGKNSSGKGGSDGNIDSKLAVVSEHVNSIMKLSLQIIHQYLYYKANLHTINSGSNDGYSYVTSTEIVVSNRNSNSHNSNNNSNSMGINFAHELVKHYSVLTGYGVECVANCALVLGAKEFRPQLMECLYPMLELLVDSDPLVKQAAKCSLDRMALYLNFSDFPDMIRQNLDYIVQESCAKLRNTTNTYNYLKKHNVHTKYPGRKNRNSDINGNNIGHNTTTTHLVVDLVFSIIGSETYSNNSISGNSSGGSESKNSNSITPIFLLKDMIFDTIENIDTLATTRLFNISNRRSGSGNNSSTVSQLEAMLKVIQVFVYRTITPPALTSLESPLLVSPYFIRKIYGSSNHTSSAAETAAKVAAAIELNKVKKQKQNKKAGKTSHTSVDENDSTAADSGSGTLDYVLKDDNNFVNTPAEEEDNRSIYEKIQDIANTNKKNKSNHKNTADPDVTVEDVEEDEEYSSEKLSDEQLMNKHDIETESTTPVPTPAQNIVLDILNRCGYFISLQNTTSTITIIETVSAALLRLNDSKRLLFPAIHQIFPPIMSRLQEGVNALFDNYPLPALPSQQLIAGRNNKVNKNSTMSSLFTQNNSSSSNSSGISGGIVLKMSSSKKLIAMNSITDNSTNNVDHSNTMHEISVRRTNIYKSDANNSGNNSVSSTDNTLSIVSASHYNTNSTAKVIVSVERIHILPVLCEFFSLLSVIAIQYITLKFREELFPEVIRVLRYYQTLNCVVADSDNSGRNSSGNSSDRNSPNKVVKLSMSDLLITSSQKSSDNRNSANDTTGSTDTAVENNDNITNSNNSNTDDAQESIGKVHNNNSNNSRFSVHSKTKLALLQMLTQLSVSNAQYRLLRSHVTVFVWYSLPFMMSCEPKEVSDLAISTIVSLSKLDLPLATTILNSIYCSHKKFKVTGGDGGSAVAAKEMKVVQIVEVRSGAEEEDEDANYRNTTASCGTDTTSSTSSRKNKISYQDALHSWNTMISHPEIVDTYRVTRKELVDDVWNKTRQQHLTTSSSGICGIDKAIQLTKVPFSEEILSSFHSDAGFMKKLGELSRAVDEM